jgi:hypothetical protein
MDMTGIEVALVVLATIGLPLMLVATLIWLVAVIVKAIVRGRVLPPGPTRR